jgi:vancomycin resistance protein VanW
LYNHHYYHSKKSKNSSKILGKTFLILIALIVFFLLIYSIDSLILYRGKIYPNLFALNQSIGGLKKEQAYQTLQPVLDEIITSPVLVDYEGWRLKVRPDESLGLSIDLEKLFNEAYSIGRRGTFLSRIKERTSLIRNAYQIRPPIKLNENIFESFYHELQMAVEKPSRDASFASERIIPAQIGVKIDREHLLKEIEDSIIDSAQYDNPIIINLPVHYQKPDVSTKEILAHIGVFETLSSYETSLLGKEKNTLYNIEKSAGEIDGIIVKPGEVISFNRLIGPADKGDGYKESTIIANGQFVSGYGGGVCQVSTTLYNAALLANLEIVERYNHSIYGTPTSYVPLGQDAAVFYGYKDLKFKNSTDQQIVIFSEVKADRLIITIWGEKMLDKEIRVINQDLKTYDYDVIEIKREEQKTGNFASNVLQEGIPGYSVKTYRIIIDSSGETMEFLSDDRYISVPAKIFID